jgi:hypothetical protein
VCGIILVITHNFLIEWFIRHIYQLSYAIVDSEILLKTIYENINIGPIEVHMLPLGIAGRT